MGLPEPGQAIHDDRGRLLGWRYTRFDGKAAVRGLDGLPRGYYDPVTDTTRDLSGSQIGIGDILERLVGGRPLPRVRTSRSAAVSRRDSSDRPRPNLRLAESRRNR